MIRRLFRDGYRMLWPLLIAAIVSKALDQTWPLLVTLSILLAWQIWQKWRLARWLARGDLLDPPHAGGLWEDYYTRLMHLFRTEQKSQSALTAIIERARHCADAVDEGVLLLNTKGELEYSNQAALNLLDLRGQDRGEALVKLLRDPMFRTWLEARDFKQRLTLPAPVEKRTLQYRGTALDNGDLLLRVEDISRLQALEHLRRDFVANISHELKTPLTIFKGYLELLEDQLSLDSPTIVRQALEHMGKQSERMEVLVRDLLTLSRLETTQNKLPQPVNLTVLLSRIFSTYQQQIKRKHQLLHQEIPPEICFNGVADELESAFGNLLSNAIKYTPKDGSIRVRAWQDDDGLHIAFSDTGIGIATHHLPHLTERFYRVDDSRHIDSGGTGLGLAIVKHVLQRHNAELSITSTLGQGSCFTCHFPVSL